MRSFWSCLCLALALLLGAVPAARAELTVCSAGCNVSNLIDSDHTWKADIYRVQEQIQVRPGATLTLEPGVTLRFTAPETGLRVEGTLIARGTGENEGQRITFTSGQATPAPGDWGSILFTGTAVGASFDGTGNHIGGSIFKHCIVEYAGGGGALGVLWAQSPRAPYVHLSTIQNNDTSGVRLEGPPDAGGHPQGVQEARVRQSEVLRNRMGDGGGAYVVVSASGTAAIRENRIVYNTASHQGGGIHVRQGQPILSRNDIFGNALAQLWDGNAPASPASQPHLNARDNWWGSADEAEIQQGIWDGNDDPALGMVDWQPSRTAPVFSNHPPAPPALLKRNTGYSWRVVARDSQGEKTFGPRWSFRTGSSPFLLYPIGNKTVNEGQALSFTLSGNSPDGAPLTFSASNLPPGASFDPAARRFSWTPTRDQAGIYAGVRFEVTNGTYTNTRE